MLENKLHQLSSRAFPILRRKPFSLAHRFFSCAENTAINDIVVIGAGCIGQGITASLLMSNKNNRVFLIPSVRTVKRIQEHGINIQGAVETTFSPGRNLIVEEELIEDTLTKYNISKRPIIFLATKDNLATQCLSTVQALLQPPNKPAIICLQNGLGTEESIRTAVKPLSALVLKGHVFSALHQRGSSVFAYKGNVIVQQHPDFNKTLKTIFGNQDSGIFNLKLSDNILHAIYPKLTVNCVCNPLTVIFNENLGSLRLNHESLIRSICDEVYNIATAQGLYFESSTYLAGFVLETMEKYSAHYSSMYLDVAAGKETEIERINGAIVRIGIEKSVGTPLNMLLTTAIKNIERLRSSCASSEEFYKRHTTYLSTLQTQLLSYTLTKRWRAV
jgi:2-dehydropantoate 2-reductase